MPGTTGREGPPQQGVSPLARAGQEPDGAAAKRKKLLSPNLCAQLSAGAPRGYSAAAVRLAGEPLGSPSRTYRSSLHTARHSFSWSWAISLREQPNGRAAPRKSENSWE